MEKKSLLKLMSKNKGYFSNLEKDNYFFKIIFIVNNTL